MEGKNMSDNIMDIGLNTLAAMENERKEPCIHCEKVWYVIHHEDGVCHECQRKGVPGRAAQAARKRAIRRSWAIGFVLLGLSILCAVSS